MVLHDLRTRLLRILPAKALVVDAALLESESLATLWKASLGIDEIRIRDPQVFDSDTRVIVKGKTSFLKVEEMSTELAFEDDHGSLQLRLTANLPYTWTFSQSFPDLSPFFNYDSLNYGYAPSYLDQLTFSSPAFVLTTRPFRDPVAAISLERGLSFVGFVNLAGPLKDLEILTGGPAAVQVSGLIISDTPAPEFCLSARIPLSLGQEADKLRFENIQLKLWNSLKRNTPRTARIEVSLQLTIAGRSMELYFPYRMGAPLDFLVIGGRFGSIPLPDLGKLAHLVGGDDLQSRLPPTLGSLGGLTIEEVVTGFSLSGPELAYVRVSVAATSPWTIIPEILKLDSLALTWLVESPFKSDQRDVSCALVGLLHVAEVGFNLYAEWPGFQVSGALAPGSIIRLGALLKYFAPNIPLPDDSLLITQLALLADPASKAYQIDARVDNVWSLRLGEATLRMDSLAFSLARTTEQLTGSLTGCVSLGLTDDVAGRDLALSLTASLPTPLARGWQFAGGTGPGQSIKVDKLIQWLEKSFRPRAAAVCHSGILHRES